MHYVQFSIIKCCFYAKNEIYRRGYTSYSDSFIHLCCMF
nr:MAG TPA: Paired box protein 7 [Caudoviricetes sp.]